MTERKSPEPKPDFFVFSAPLSVKDDQSKRPTLVATASSTAIDLEADRFTSSALEQMRDGFKGRVIFMNHSYRVPMDVFGVVEETSLVKREGRLDLDMVIRVETGNPLAMQTYEYVLNGTRLGVSVGVLVTESEKSDDEDEYGTRIVDITGVIPLEASIVGIPANQTAWTHSAIKSLYERGAIDFDESEVAARPWLGADESQEVDDMAKKHTPEGDKPKEETPAEQHKEEAPVEAPASESDDSSDERPNKTDDQEGEDEEGGGDDEHDANDGDGDHSDHSDHSDHKEAAPDNDDEPKPETKDDPDENSEETPDGNSGESPDENSEESPDEVKGDDDGGETKNDFDDDVAADEAAYTLIDKMYTGFYVALDNLIPIILDTEMGSDARRKAGDEVIESWSNYIAETWDEVIEMLDESKAVDMDEDFSLAARLHGLVAADESVECEATEVNQIVEQARAIESMARKHADENATLRKEVEQKVEGLRLASEIIDAVMELPIPTVTTKTAELTRSLADRFPHLDNKVVELLVRSAPPAPAR